uniref:ATP synthase membrane subunit g n=1 Tax=Homo sapiens TaxID=9606 RepID=E9PN17_HUMAN
MAQFVRNLVEKTPALVNEKKQHLRILNSSLLSDDQAFLWTSLNNSATVLCWRTLGLLMQCVHLGALWRKNC